MSEAIDLTRTESTGRQFAYGLGFVLAIVIGIPVALFLAFSASCACTSPPDLVVLNYAHEDASVSWQGPGPLGLPVLGISGSAVVPACSTHAVTLRPGQVSVTISVSEVART
jgi:hypothetical protein